jgi:predicted nucleic acid-binding protein
MTLLDTDVLIECLRGVAAAQAWLASVESIEFGVPGVVAMELIVGCTTKRHLEQTERFLATFTILWPGEADMALAFQLLVQHRLTGGLGIPDCLIAAQAINRSALLYSFNLRHFTKVNGLQVQQPFPRT